MFVDLTHDDTKTPSPTLQLSSPSAPNAPSKTPSTKNTFPSSIDYIPKSPTSLISLSPNGYLNPPISPPPRVSPPPPTQKNASMDITLTLSLITPLDVQFDTPSPSPPIFGHPIPWNLLEAHGDSFNAGDSKLMLLGITYYCCVKVNVARHNLLLLRENPDFPDRVHKVEKHCMDYIKLLELGPIYVDDIIFGSTKKELCNAFEKLMHEKFQMSSMGELTFFLGLQVQQKKDGIFISQDKYVEEILKKFGFTEVKTASTPMETQKPLLKDEDGEEVHVHMYRSIIGSLMYLTSSRPDIMFAVCACARYQVNPKVLHLHAVKRIFRYLKGQLKLCLWYSKDSPFDLVAYTDSDYAGVSLDRKSTT
ncbi:putative ribonuclease H-like domain-containing protein [Tanacetum coccineum]